MPNTRPLTTTQAAPNDELQRAASKSLVNYGFFIEATAANLSDLREVHSACGIKIFMGSSHGDLIATDRTPHNLEEKAKVYPNSPSGMPGVETSLPLMLTQAMQSKCTLI